MKNTKLFNLFALILLSLLVRMSNVLAQEKLDTESGVWQLSGSPDLKLSYFTYKVSNIFVDQRKSYLGAVDPINGKNIVFVSEGESWKSSGNPGISDKESCKPALTAKDGIIYFAFPDKDEKGKVTVMKIENGQCQALGKPGISRGKVGSIDLKFNNNDLYLAFQDAKVGFKGSVMKFNGTGWDEVGAAGFTGSAVADLKLAFDNSTPYVAFRDLSVDFRISVMKYNGNSWETMGARGFCNSQFNPFFLLFNKNIPYFFVINRENPDNYSAPSFALLLKYDGPNWVNNLKEELNPGYPDVIYAGFDNDKVVYRSKRIESFFSQPEAEDIDGNSKKERLARAESEKKASGDTIPSISTVIDPNGILKIGVKGCFKIKGYSLLFDKKAAAMLFEKGTSVNEYDVATILSDTMILVRKNGLYGLFTAGGLKVPVKYEGFSPVGTQSFIVAKDGKTTFYSIGTNKFLGWDYQILGTVKHEPYTSLVQKGDLCYFIQPDNLKFIGMGFTPEKDKTPDQYGDISTVRTPKGLAYIDLTNGNVLESIDSIIFPFNQGVSRIIRGGRTYNIDLNFKEVPDDSELGENNCYLTLIVPKKSAEAVKWKPLYVSIYRANAGLAFSKYPDKRIKIDGYINSVGEVPKKYANVQFSSFSSTTNGFITVMLPIGEYSFTISYSTGTQEKVHPPHKLTFAKGIKHQTLTLDLHE